MRLASCVVFRTTHDAYRIRPGCPRDHFAYFHSLLVSRTEFEMFVRNARDEHDLIGVTYLHPDFTLGSINIGDLWNQRRPLVAYWQGPNGPVAVRLRLLRDDYDYASASILTVQDQADVLGAVLFATDRGDTHISLDRIANATIRARDLRLRLQFEGAVEGLAFPNRPALREAIHFASGPVEGTFHIHAAEFDGLPVRLETRQGWGEVSIDLILYQGGDRTFDFRRMAEAAVVFTLSIASADPTALRNDPSVSESVAYDLTAAGIDSPRRTWSLHRANRPTLSLTVPTKPLPTKQQAAAAEARLDGDNPWKSSH